MGGCGFNTVSYGKTPSEAFGRATDEARYEYGHNGYTGTIAEKYDFVLLTLPPGIKAQEFYEATVSFAYNNTEYFTSRKAFAVAWRKTPHGAKATRLYRKWVKNPELMGLVKRASDIYDDKWGPAVAVELTRGEATQVKQRLFDPRYSKPPARGTKFFLFFGVASS